MEDQQRPNGASATVIGFLLIAVGLIAALFTGATESSGGWIFGLALANLGIGLGVLLLSLGYLVRAIWFLPGRQVTSQPSTARCDWCERVLPHGQTTCESLSPIQLTNIAGQVDDPICIHQFKQRGIGSETPNG